MQAVLQIQINNTSEYYQRFTIPFTTKILMKK